MTRIYTDEAEVQGSAWASQAALPNQTLWQASLPTRLFLNRSIRSANVALHFAHRARLRNCQELAFRKSTGQVRLAGMAGFLKRHLQARLREDLQKARTIRAANNPSVFLLPHPC